MLTQPALVGLRNFSFFLFSVGIIVAISGGARLPVAQQLKAEIDLLEGKAKELNSLPDLLRQAKQLRKKAGQLREENKQFLPKIQALRTQKLSLPADIATLHAEVAKTRARASRARAKAMLLTGEALRKQKRLLQSLSQKQTSKKVTPPTPPKVAPTSAPSQNGDWKQMKQMLGRFELQKKIKAMRAKFRQMVSISTAQMEIAELREKASKAERFAVELSLEALKIELFIQKQTRVLEKLPSKMSALRDLERKTPAAVEALLKKAKKTESRVKELEKSLKFYLSKTKLPRDAGRLMAKVAMLKKRFATLDPKGPKVLAASNGGPSTKKASIWPESTPVFFGGVLLTLLALVMWRTSVRREIQQRMTESGDKNSNPFALLERMQPAFERLQNDLDGMQNPEICERVDEILNEFVLPLAEVRRLVIERLGMNSGAEVLVIVAYGERMLNRVWSAAADGHRPEAVSVLPDAIAAFAEAHETATKHLASLKS